MWLVTQHGLISPLKSLDAWSGKPSGVWGTEQHRALENHRADGKEEGTTEEQSNTKHSEITGRMERRQTHVPVDAPLGTTPLHSCHRWGPRPPVRSLDGEDGVRPYVAGEGDDGEADEDGGGVGAFPFPFPFPANVAASGSCRAAEQKWPRWERDALRRWLRPGADLPCRRGEVAALGDGLHDSEGEGRIVRWRIAGCVIDGAERKGRTGKEGVRYRTSCEERRPDWMSHQKWS